MCTWISGVLLVLGNACVMRATRLSRLVAISRCLDECKSCIGVGPSGRFERDDDRIFCHLVAMGVARGSWVVAACVRDLRWSGDSACRSLRK